MSKKRGATRRKSKKPRRVAPERPPEARRAAPDKRWTPKRIQATVALAIVVALAVAMVVTTLFPLFTFR